MKTVVRKLHYIAVLAALVVSLASCEVDVAVGNHTLAYRENTEYLCSFVWTDEWYDEFGDYHYQELYFYPDNTGEDYIRVQDRWGFVQEYSYRFRWDWYDSFFTSIRLNYGGGDYSYMDNMRMYNARLDCLLDGSYVTFIGY